MIGAILGDIVGSPYEFDKGQKIKDFGPLFIDSSRFTDDTVMTIAIADGLMNAVSLSGDCDTLTCIAGSIAEAFYGVPADLKLEVEHRIPDEFKEVLQRFSALRDKRCLAATPAQNEESNDEML